MRINSDQKSGRFLSRLSEGYIFGMNNIGKKIDLKNIELAKILHCLRSDLDIYTLVKLNMGRLKTKGSGKSFWARVQRLSVCSIALGICKIYEDEKHHELNSVLGLMNLIEKQGLVSLGRDNSNCFYADYKQYASDDSPSSAHLRNIVKGYLASKSSELSRFKIFRDKVIAHGEFSASIESLPPFGEMEQLYEFAKKFYYIVGDDYVGLGHVNLDSNRKLRVGLKTILGYLLDNQIKMEWEN